VRPSEYGNHLNQAIEGWFFYIRNGRFRELSQASGVLRARRMAIRSDAPPAPGNRVD
jgi:hypothetical protein